jgi:PPP family 3-phenylpropionic acid transporter
MGSLHPRSGSGSRRRSFDPAAPSVHNADPVAFDREQTDARAHWLLGAHWFLATAALGVHFPYFALLLRENVGLPASQIGIVLAIPPIVGLVAQPAWGHLADRKGSRVRVLALLCAGAAAGFAALAHAQSLMATLLATLLLASFLSALFPMAVSVSFGVVSDPLHFGRVRVWGTIGYFVVVVAAPPLLHMLHGPLALHVRPGGPSEPALPLAFYGAALLSLLGGGVALLLPNNRTLAVRAGRGDLRALLRERPFRRVLAFHGGIQFFLHGPMSLFPLYVRSRGGDMTDLSHMWIFMLLLEVPLIFLSGALFARLGTVRVMTLAAAAGSVRWLASAAVPTLAYAYPVQMLHALMVTGLGVGVATHVERLVPAHLRSSGQSLLVMLGGSLGGGTSSVLSGIIVERFGVDALLAASGIGGLAFTAWARRSLLAPR